MRDACWKDAWIAARQYICPADKVLLPRGDWPHNEAVDVRYYDDRIDVDDATIFLLHKGRMGCIETPTLQRIFRTWQIFHANGVFICFRKRHSVSALLRSMPSRRHTRILKRHFNSRRLKRTDRTVFFVHLPKTAGTSVWAAFGRSVQSKIYYETYPSFLANPPAAGAYDLVGGHVPLRIMEPYVRSNDAVMCLYREPVSRFRSAFLHSRRPDEDPATFSPVMQAMRTMPLREFLKLPVARMEICQQSLMLGFSFQEHYTERLDDAIFSQIEHYVRDPRHIIMTSDAIGPFVNRAVGLLHASPMVARRHNVSDIARQWADVAEFQDCLEEVKALSALDEAVYQLIKVRQGNA